MLRRRISIAFPSSLLNTLPSLPITTIFKPFLLQNISQCLSSLLEPRSLYPRRDGPDGAECSKQTLKWRHSRGMCPACWAPVWQETIEPEPHIMRTDMMNKPGAVQFLLREDVTHGRLGKRFATNRRCSVPRCLRYRTAEVIRGVIGEGEAANCFHKQDSNDRVTAGTFTGERDCS
jgi:hypothetical protein